MKDRFPVQKMKGENKMNIDFSSIGESTMMRLTKNEVIDIINKTFPDDKGCIAVITGVKFRDKDLTFYNQSITFGKQLELD